MVGRSIDWALASVFVVLPLLPTGPTYLGFARAPWVEIGALVLSAIWIVALVADRSSPTSRGGHRLGGVFLPLAAFVTGAALVGLAAENPVGSPAFAAVLADLPRRLVSPMDPVVDPLQPARAWLTLVEGLVAAFLVARICRAGPDPVRRAALALGGAVLGACLVSAFAIFQYVTRFRLHPFWVAANPDLTRSHSTLEDPNALGSFLAVSLGLAVSLAWRHRGGGRGLWFAGASVLLLVGLATTVSRAAWGALPLALALVGAWGVPSPDGGRLARWKRRSRIGLVAAAVVAAAWLVAHALLPPRAPVRPSGPIEAVLVTIDPRMPLTATFKDRQDYWTAAVNMAQAHPWSGVGLGRFVRLGPRYNPEVEVPGNAHNFFLQLLAEAGVGGLAALLLALGGLLWCAHRAAADPATRALATGLSFALTVLALTSLTGHPLLLPSFQILFGAVAAAWCVALDGPFRPPAAWMRPALPAAASAVGLLLLAGHALGLPWNGAPNGWGYTAGLHGYETDADGQPFRRTTGSAWLHLRPPAGASVLDLSFAVLFAPQSADAATVTITVAGRVRTVGRVDSGWTTVSFAVPPTSDGLPADLDVHIVVDPVRVSAALRESSDVRELGVAIRPPVFRVPEAGMQRRDPHL